MWLLGPASREEVGCSLVQAQERRENDWRCKSAGALAAGVCPGVGVLVLLVTNLLMAHQDSVARQPETRRSERSHAHLLDESPVLPEDKSPIALVGFCSHTPQRYGHVSLPSPGFHPNPLTVCREN